MMTNFFPRFATWILAIVALTAPLGLYGAVQALRTNYNNAEDWLPAHLPEIQEYRWFLDHFEGDEVLIVSWPGCTLSDPRLAELTKRVGGTRVPNTDEPLFRRVVSGQSVLSSLTAAPLFLSPAAARERLLGWLLGPDKESTCAILMISRAGTKDRHAAMDAVYLVAEEVGLTRQELRFGGPTVDSVAIDDESTRSLYRLSVLSTFVGFVLCWFSLRSFRLVAAVFSTALLCEGWSLAIVYYTGTNVDAVLTIMPALVYVLAICAGIHLLTCYQELVRNHGNAGAAGKSVAMAWQPTFMASITTALGLVSLCVSDVVPVRKFGAFSAIGVAESLMFLFLYLPSFLEKFPVRAAGSLQSNEARHPTNALRWDERLSAWAVDHHRRLITAVLVLMGLLSIGVLSTRTSIRLSDMFYESSPVIEDYHWLETRVGSLVPIDIVLQFAPSSRRTMLERLELSELAREAVKQTPEVGGVASVATFLPPVPASGSLRGIAQRVVLNRRMERYRDRLVAAGHLADSRDGELWLINGRVGAFETVEYGEIVQRLKTDVSQALERRLGDGQTEVSVIVCGGVPLINMVQRRLLNDLGSSFGTAILTIGILLAVALRSLLAAVVLLIPNVLPILLVFGVMGWLGITVDLGSMLTVSTAIGITVDNELHFLAWYRRALARGLSQRQALAATFNHCGQPMVQTGVICSLGMLAFALSTFVPTARFGWLMFLLISTAMLGDLLVLPALLASAVGRRFARIRPIELPAMALEPGEIAAST